MVVKTKQSEINSSRTPGVNEMNVLRGRGGSEGSVLFLNSWGLWGKLTRGGLGVLKKMRKRHFFKLFEIKKKNLNYFINVI